MMFCAAYHSDSTVIIGLYCSLNFFSTIYREFAMYFKTEFLKKKSVVTYIEIPISYDFKYVGIAYFNV